MDCMGSSPRTGCTGFSLHRDSLQRTGCKDSSLHTSFSPHRGSWRRRGCTGSSRHTDYRDCSPLPGDAVPHRPMSNLPHSRRKARRGSRRTGCRGSSPRTGYTGFSLHRDYRDYTGSSPRTGYTGSLRHMDCTGFWPRMDSLQRRGSSRRTGFWLRMDFLQRRGSSPRMDWPRPVRTGLRPESRRPAPTIRRRPEVPRVSRPMTEAMI